MKKFRISSRLRKLKTINNFIDIIINRKSFLLSGHEHPDEDCVASMVAYSLLLTKFSKNPTVVIDRKYWERFSFLIDICKYNTIKLIGKPEEIRDTYDTIMIFDTPKPSMMEFRDEIEVLMNREDVITMEIDHHLEADGEFIGDEGYRFVDEASSTCELIGYLTLKLSKRKELLHQYVSEELFTRNFVLSIITGIAGDSKMGQYLKSRREKHYYRIFSRIFNKMLTSKTNENSGNFSSLAEIISNLEMLSQQEQACFKAFISYKQSRDKITYIALDESAINTILKEFDNEIIITIARYAANVLAEESGFISLVAYYDNLINKDLIQLRMRRSMNFKDLDLRTIINHFNIENGGGHEGAIGFRIPKSQISDFPKFIENLIDGTTKLIERSQ